MPQMMPLMWLTLYIFFSMTLLMFNAMNYSIMMPKYLKSKNKLIKKMTNWKW